jgi:hypothetical protein
LIDTDGVVVLLLLLRVEDTALVTVLLLMVWDVDDPEDDTGVFVEDESADDVANGDADASDVVLVVLVDDGDGNDDGDSDGDDDGGDDSVEGVSEACADVEEAAD